MTRSHHTTSSSFVNLLGPISGHFGILLGMILESSTSSLNLISSYAHEWKRFTEQLRSLQVTKTDLTALTDDDLNRLPIRHSTNDCESDEKVTNRVGIYAID